MVDEPKRKGKNIMKMNLQFFAEGEEGDASQNSGEGNTNQNSGNGDASQNSGTNNNAQNSNNTQQGIDYNKLQTMIDNATAKKEDIVLRDYFKQQGMTKEEVKQAVDTYKATRQQNQQSTPDTSELESKIAEAQKAAQKAKIELEATKVAVSLGIDSKTLPYVLKMADMSSVIDKDGKLNSENIKTSLNKVLEDIPALKNVKEETKGFQIGGSGQNGNGQGGQQQLAVPAKRWNRFN